jgi:hypothetical protein
MARLSEDAASIRGKIAASFKRGAHGGDEFVTSIALEDVPSCAAIDGLPDDRTTILDRDEHDSRVRLSRENRRGCGEPVDAWHRDIADDRVRQNPPHRFDEGHAVLHDFDEVVIDDEELVQLCGVLFQDSAEPIRRPDGRN